jgi:hypothetical protein
MPVASKEVIEAYFKANPTAKKFCNTLPTFLKMTSQASGLINKENKDEDKEEVDKAFKLKSALSFIECSQLSSLLAKLCNLIASLIYNYITFCLCEPCIFFIYNLILYL